MGNSRPPKSLLELYEAEKKRPDPPDDLIRSTFEGILDELNFERSTGTSSHGPVHPKSKGRNSSIFRMFAGIKSPALAAAAVGFVVLFAAGGVVWQTRLDHEGQSGSHPERSTPSRPSGGEVMVGTLMSNADEASCAQGLKARFSIARTKRNGNDWDVSIGRNARPDPYGSVWLRTADGMEYSTRIRKRKDRFVFRAVLFRGKVIAVGQRARVRVWLKDKDLRRDDHIATLRATVDKIPATIRRGRLTMTLKCLESR